MPGDLSELPVEVGKAVITTGKGHLRDGAIFLVEHIERAGDAVFIEEACKGFACHALEVAAEGG